MEKLLSRRYILLYLFLGIAFTFLFNRIESYYIVAGGPTPSPIDSHGVFKFFDTGYVIAAKTGYNIPHYFRSFFIVDLFFPVIYTLLFLSVFQLLGEKRIFPVFQFTAIAGCLFDYLENFSFAIFLHLKEDGLALPVAVATSIKGLFFAINILAVMAIIFLVIAGKIPKTGFDTNKRQS